MSVMNSVNDLQSETAKQMALDHANKIANSANDRNVGGEMGKNDFLMLLVAQLRHQNPLEPSNDSEFATQLAQFSSLEQMQNMSSSLESMNNYQAYSLVGKLVMAEALIDGEFGEFAGVVESIFVDKGITYAQIGEYVVPVASIKEVFDSNNVLTPEMFLQASAQLIGRTVIAMEGEDEIEGTVTRVLVDKGSLFAQIDDGTDEPKFVSVNAIVDIREPGTIAYRPKPETPPDAVNFKKDPDSDGFLEIDEDFDTVIGRWDWDKDQWKWVYTDLSSEEIEEIEEPDELNKLGKAA